MTTVNTSSRFGDFNTVNSLFHNEDAVLPAALEAVALAGGVFYSSSSSDILPPGKALNNDPALLHDAMEKLGYKLFADVETGSSRRRIYSLRGAHAYARLATARGRVYLADFYGPSEDFPAWRDAVIALAEEKVFDEKTGTTVYLLVGNGQGRYSLAPCGEETATLVDSNYDPDVASALHAAAKEIIAPEPSGRLLLLDGPPGTGKTRAVRALIASMEDKARVVIVPAHLMADLAGPDLIGVLIGAGQPTVLVIEDADYALLDREERSAGDKQGATGSLASILNLSDGIIGAQIDLRVIATTNASVAHLDAAVLRPGRLLNRIAFGPLNHEQVTRALCKMIPQELRNVAVQKYMDREPPTPKTLAEVYKLAGDLRAIARAHLW